MQSYREWLELDEARVKTQRGGWVNDIQAQQGSAIGTTGMDYNTRVSRGKYAEKKMKDALQTMHNINITGSGNEEDDIRGDVDRGIDGYWGGDRSQSVQLKYRDTGDDILFELIKPHDPFKPVAAQLSTQPGRDWRGESVYYVVLSRDGRTIRKIKTADIKFILQMMLDRMGDMTLETGQTHRFMGIELKAQEDRRSGVKKIVAYIPPNIIRGGEEFPVNVNLRK